MQLPFKIDDPHIQRFIAYWESQRHSADLPVWDGIAAERAMPDLTPSMATIEVREPKILYVRHAGINYRNHYGYEISGTDLLQYTRPEDLDERFRRFHILATQPCAAFFRAPVAGSHNITIVGDAMWLPFREQGSGKVLLVTCHSLDGERIYVERSPAIMPMAPAFHFIDVGFGAPSLPATSPNDDGLKAKVTRRLKALGARLF
ncbi:MAG: hypothetical protein ACOH12_08730 [Parvibaculaceae bacterium]